MTEQLELHVLPMRDMQFSGDSFLKSIQNPSLPLIDLFVRESVQNSLDAAISDDGYVSAEIKTGNINKDLLLKKLNGIDIKAFENDECDFVYIRDSGTKGLTGPLKITDKNNEGRRNRNLRRLIYEIGNTHPESDEKKGGSWGYGKTVFFNLGKGIVIYYSRSNENNKYREILTISLAERNTEGFRSVLKKEYLKNYTGIAWWDKKDKGEECSYPLTDPSAIKEIISIFGIKPYEKEETGTCIIIPFLRTTELVDDSFYKTGAPLERLDCQITLSLWKWYFPRLNIFFKGGAKLIIPDRNDNKYKIFNDLLQLYTAAMIIDVRERLEKQGIYTEEIKSTRQRKAGTLAYKKINLDPQTRQKIYKILGMSDYVSADTRSNAPIMLYSRRFGMIVDYSDKFGRISIPSTDNSTVLLAYFISDSDAIVDGKMTVESYIRQCEKADHNYWDDHTIEIDNKKKNHLFIRTFQKSVRDILKNYICPEKHDNDTELKKNRSIQQELGKYFLPQGFGTFNSAKTGGKFPDGRKTSSSTHQITNDMVLTFEQNKFEEKNIVIVNFHTKKMNEEPINIKISLYTKTIDKTFSAKDWEQTTDSSKSLIYTGTEFPAQIISVKNKDEIITLGSADDKEVEKAPESQKPVGIECLQKKREEDWTVKIKKSDPKISVVIKVERI